MHSSFGTTKTLLFQSPFATRSHIKRIGWPTGGENTDSQSLNFALGANPVFFLFHFIAKGQERTAERGETTI